MDFIQQGSVAVNNLRYDFVAHLDWLRYASQLLTHPFEVSNLNNRQFGVDQFLFEFLILAACSVDCDTSLGNNNIDGLAWPSASWRSGETMLWR